MFKSWDACQNVAGAVKDVPPLRCVKTAIENVIAAAYLFVGSIAVIMIIWGAIKYITSGGDAKKIEDGKKTIIYGVIGLLIVLFAGGIVYLVGSVTGTPIESLMDVAL